MWIGIGYLPGATLRAPYGANKKHPYKQKYSDLQVHLYSHVSQDVMLRVPLYSLSGDKWLLHLCTLY